MFRLLLLPSRVCRALFASLLLACAVGAIAQPLDYGDIPLSRIPPTPWEPYAYVETPGAWTTVDVTQHGLPANTSATDAGPAILSILSGYSTSTKVKLYFPTGTYYLKSHLDIPRGNVWICGDGPGNSVIKIDVPTGDTSEFRFWPVPITLTTGASGSFPRGTAQLPVSDATGIDVGDVVKVFQPLDGNFIGQLVEITHKSGNTLTFTPKLGVTLVDPTVQRREFVDNVKVTDIKFDRIREAPQRTNNLTLRRTRNFLVKSVESTGHAAGAIYTRDVLRGEITECYVHRYKGPLQGSWGDGIMINDFSTQVHIHNNTSELERHGIWIGQSVSHCVIAYNLTISSRDYADMGEHHGGAAHNNLFEGNTGYEIYSDIMRTSHQDTLYSAYFRNSAFTKVGFEKFPQPNQILDNDHYNGMVVGNVTEATRTTRTVDGSDVGLLTETIDGFIGANETPSGMVWGALSPTSEIPPSLAYPSKPYYVATWPLHGPGSGGGTPTEVIVDNTGPGFTSTGTWYVQTSPNDYGTNYLTSTAGSGADTARFTPVLTGPGTYHVYAWWVQYTNRATNTPFAIQHANGTSNLAINQQINGAQWVLLGTYDFDGGTSGYVQISDNANGGVVADAVRFVPVITAPVLSLEAEEVPKTGNFITASDAAASGQHYMIIPNGQTTGSSTLTFAFTVTEAGLYRIRGYGYAPSGGDNSFWVSVNGGSELNWHLAHPNTSFAADWVNNVGVVDPYEVNLSPGQVTVQIRGREDGTGLDRLELVKQ